MNFNTSGSWRMPEQWVWQYGVLSPLIGKFSDTKWQDLSFPYLSKFFNKTKTCNKFVKLATVSKPRCLAQTHPDRVPQDCLQTHGQVRIYSITSFPCSNIFRLIVLQAFRQRICPICKKTTTMPPTNWVPMEFFNRR